MRTLYGVIILIIVGLLTACATDSTDISGWVVDENGKPIVDAVVRIKATEAFTRTDQDGIFNIMDLPRSELFFVTAWATGFFIGGVEDIKPGSMDVEIVLHAHSPEDNPLYEWLPSTYHQGEGENQGCSECHSAAGAELGFSLPVDEWLLDAHSQSAVNPRFISMYTGQDLAGNQSPFTEYMYSKDYGRFPLRPKPNETYYGPGYKLDFPQTAGNCAACHTPAVVNDTPYSVDPTQITGTALEGIPCDFCHKIWDVSLNPSTGIPYPNRPGVLSFEFRRPPEGHQFFAGPLDDVAPGEDTYTPIQQASEFCAPCHYGVFWNTVIYNSFGEWLESPYSNIETGKTCQDCHMPPLGVTHFALPEQGGVARDPKTIYSHRMPGASDMDLLQNALTMSVDAERLEAEIKVSVTLLNDLTGHHVPTDSPLRQMILLVKAICEDGKALTQLDGPTVPEWGGVGDPENGYFAGLAGQGYAKILMEFWTEYSPSGAYWNPSRIVSDNRIPAMGSDTTTYSFSTCSAGDITVEVDLYYRRAFIELMDQKGWEVPDIPMESVVITLSEK